MIQYIVIENIIKPILRLTFKLFFRIKIIGLENIPQKGPVLLVSNHQSFLDPPLIGVFLNRPIYFMARDTLFRNFIIAPILRFLGAFPVKRGKPDLIALKEAIKILEKGNILGIFPEGTRTHNGKVSFPKSGISIIVKKVKPVVVPVLIKGAYEAWPRHQRFPRPHPIKIIYDRPIDINLYHNLKKELPREIYNRWLKMQEDF